MLNPKIVTYLCDHLCTVDLCTSSCLKGTGTINACRPTWSVFTPALVPILLLVYYYSLSTGGSYLMTRVATGVLGGYYPRMKWALTWVLKGSCPRMKWPLTWVLGRLLPQDEVGTDMSTEGFLPQDEVATDMSTGEVITTGWSGHWHEYWGVLAPGWSGHWHLCSAKVQNTYSN